MPLGIHGDTTTAGTRTPNRSNAKSCPGCGGLGGTKALRLVEREEPEARGGGQEGYPAGDGRRRAEAAARVDRGVVAIPLGRRERASVLPVPQLDGLALAREGEAPEHSGRDGARRADAEHRPRGDAAGRHAEIGVKRDRLLARHADSDDGRATRLFLTDAGHAALKRARVLLRELNGKLCDGFSDEELDVVARWLHALEDRFPAER